MCVHLFSKSFTWLQRGMFMLTAVLIAFVSIGFATMQPVYADAPAVGDFGQPVNHHRQGGGDAGHPHHQNALFVTERSSGRCAMVERSVADDAITAFAGEHPAWQLNVGLSWYFMEPVYEKNTSVAETHDGRVAL